LVGCGSSNSGTPSYTTGSTYETSAPLVVSTIAGTAGSVGSVDATGTSARFGQANGVIVSPDGKFLYVTDYGNSTIRKMDLSNGSVTTLAGSAGLTGTTDGSGTVARFNGPHQITTDGTNLYVTDYINNSIRQIVIASGVVTTLAGSTSGSAGTVDGIGTAVRFNGPSGITITSDGTALYVTDSINNSIRKIAIATGTVTTLAISATLSNPAAIICDSSGTILYLTDFNSNMIRKILISSGVVTNIAGSTSYYGSADGTGTAASFNGPNGITLLGTNLYATDSYNNTVRKIVVATGAVTTVAGSAGTPGSTDGTGITARFNFPTGITTDGTSLYVTDSSNATIRKIQ
jgi:DNA-binding beta-propeller fold protein YncE